MRLNAKARRRWFGGLCLLTAVGMLVTGETVLQDRLSPVGFLLYWIGCFVVTALAAKAALLDAAHVRAESRAEQRVLFEETLHRIESEKHAHPPDQRSKAAPSHENAAPPPPPSKIGGAGRS